jgi:hypothetical protein
MNRHTFLTNNLRAPLKNAAQSESTSISINSNIAIICFERHLPELSLAEIVAHIPDNLNGRVLALEPGYGSGIVVYRSPNPVADHVRLASRGHLEVLGIISENTLCGFDYVCWLTAKCFYPQSLPVLSEIEELRLICGLSLMAQSKGFITA